MTRYAVGIDLGTTHSALADAALEPEPSARARPTSEVLAIEQLVTATTRDRRPLLPSFVYFAHPSEAPLALPWDATRRFAVGEHARARAAEVPGRVIASAKSWLCHTGIDRRGAVLPLGAPEDVEKISPVEASFRLLDHLGEAWAAARGAALAGQEVVLAVPASFDAVARELTAEAALAAGFDDLTLIEEPQAALYAWIEAQGERWRDHLSAGDVVLVIDLGGGTTDFCAIQASELDGSLALERIAVGDHILLGGDNMDRALAREAATQIEAGGRLLDRDQQAALVHAARVAKERLLGADAPASARVAVAGRGSQLVGSALSVDIARTAAEQVLVEGFFPVVDLAAAPRARARAGLAQVGLPYAADPGVTRHLAAFLLRSGRAGAPLLPTAVLFNGGVLKAPRLRARLLEVLGDWCRSAGAPAPRLLPGEDLDLAVARGAAFYAQVRRGQALRIRGGTPRAYYVGIEDGAPALPGVEPDYTALCIAPYGMEEGTRAELPRLELSVIVGEPVSFRFFASSARRDDLAGTTIERPRPGELDELAPIELVLPDEGRRPGDLVTVTLESSITPVGTLLVEAVPLRPVSPGERFRVELSVRGEPNA